MQPPDTRIEICVSTQKLRLLGPEGVIAEYPVSTSKFGLGSEEGSFRTPTGDFEISQKIGEREPELTIFKSRKPIGLWDPSDRSDEDLVLSRILRLDGLQEDNANTRDRFIYIHGTNQEHLIGTPASYGCIRMRNTDVADLFARVPEHTPVSIA